MISKILFPLLVTFVCVTCQSLSSSNNTEFSYSRHKRSESDQCGIPSQTTGLVIGGEEFIRGQWPWMVALMQKNSTPPKLFCGGVLISSNKVLTGETLISE